MNRRLQSHSLAVVYSAPVARRKPPVAAEGAALSEATTGQPVLARVWAVGEPAAPRPQPVELPTVAPGSKPRPRPELAFYRKYTEAMLRRYLKMSMDAGRVPSLLGRELFRSKVTSYRVGTFEDAVIFCFDMERCLSKLTADEREVIKRVGLQEYTHGEAAGLLGVSLRTVALRYGRALDRLTAILLAARLLEPLARLAGE